MIFYMLNQCAEFFITAFGTTVFTLGFVLWETFWRENVFAPVTITTTIIKVGTVWVLAHVMDQKTHFRRQYFYKNTYHPWSGMKKEKILQIKMFNSFFLHFLTIVGLPLLMSCPTSWKMLLQLILLSTVPLFTMTATASRICSRTYFWRLEKMCTINIYKSLS